MKNIFFLWLASSLFSFGALTVVVQEPFQTLGTLNSTSTGNLGTVTGSFYKRAVGPHLTGDTTANSQGWSADLHGIYNTFHKINDTTSFPVTTYNQPTPVLRAFDFWVYITNYGESGSPVTLFTVNQPNTNYLANLTLGTTSGSPVLTPGTAYASSIGSTGGSVTTSNISIAYNTWYEVRIAWQTRSTRISGGGAYFEYDCSELYRPAGGSWTEFATFTDLSTGAYLTYLTAGMGSANASTFFAGRYGCPTVYSMGSFSDRTASAPSISDPPSGPFQWYLSPTGNDSNDGTTSATAWLSANMASAESGNTGMFPATNYSSGDTLTVNTTSANLVLGSSSLVIATPGLNLVQTGGGRAGTGEIQAWKAISAASWGSVAGDAGVYSCNDTDTSAVVWQNDMWLNHATGANLVAVAASLVSTSGSFWTDGTTLYLHPFGDTNPGTDGNVYTRSYNRSTSSAVVITAPNCHINGLRVRKTCTASMTSNDPGVNYCLQGQSGFGGTTLIENCYLDYGSKHELGMTDGNSNSSLTISNVECEQGSPYASQTPFVSFSGGSSASGNVHTYTGCICLKDTGKIGSTTGNSGVSQAFYSHNSAGSNQFALISLNSCNFGSSTIGGTNAIVTLNVSNCQLGGDAGTGAQSKNFSRCLFLTTPPSETVATGNMTISNCVYALNNSLVNDSLGAAQGNVTITNSTIDFTNCLVQGGYTTPGFLTRTGAITLNFSSNAVIFPAYSSGTNSFSVFKNFKSADTITSNHNVIYLNGQTVAQTFNNSGTVGNYSTLAAWQALGYDAGSGTATATMTNTLYVPLPGSPLLRYGVNVGPLIDYTGKLWSVRKTVGAIEVPVSGGLPDAL